MKNTNRWGLVAVGVIVLLFAGMIYAWSVLSVPIAKEFSDWTKAELSMTFTIIMILFCLGQLIYGNLTKLISPRTTLWISGALFLVGFVGTAKINSLMGIYIGFGIVCGLACGLAYNVILSTIIKWFPDKKGLASGILLMGFGIGSFIIGKVYQAFTPAQVDGWRTSFIVMGIAIFVVFTICGFFIKTVPAGYIPPGGIPMGAKKEDLGIEMNSKAMLRSSAFYLYYVWAILMSASGLAIISQAVGMIKEVGPNIEPGNIATIVGLISIFNGVGRVVTGQAYDKLGRKFAMNMVTLLFVATAGFAVFALKSDSLTLLIVGFIITGLAYGGIPTCNSAYISNTFGQANYPINFPLVNTALIFASFSSTISGGLYDKTQSYMATFILILALAVLGIVCSVGISSQVKKLKGRSKSA